MPFIEAQAKNTDTQIDVKDALRHSRLEINAGRFFRDWYLIQRGKIASKMAETTRQAMFWTSRTRR